MIRLLKRAVAVLFTDVETGKPLSAEAVFHVICSVVTGLILIMLYLQLGLLMGH